MGSGPHRTAELEHARLRAVLRDRFGRDPETAEFGRLPFGAFARVGTQAWIISASPDPGLLGGVLVWADRHSVEEIDLIVEHEAGVHTRRAGALGSSCVVWKLEGTEVRPVEAEALPAPAEAPVGLEEFEAMIVRAGAEVVHEDGIVRAEVSGLEVGRVVIGPDGPFLESGVGRFDREAGVLLGAHREPGEALAAVVDQVRPHRRVGAVPHPIGRLARGRWLRSVLLQDPSLAGISAPQPVEPIPPRLSLLEDPPGALMGRDGERFVLVVCSVGVVLGLVPEVADLVERHGPAEVRVMQPTRDRHPAVEDLAARVRVPVTFHDIVPPWTTTT